MILQENWVQHGAQRLSCERVTEALSLRVLDRHWWWKQFGSFLCFDVIFLSLHFKSKHHCMFVFLLYIYKTKAAGFVVKWGQSLRLDKNFLLILPPQQKVLLDSWKHWNLFLLWSHFVIISAQMHIDVLIRRTVFTAFSLEQIGRAGARWKPSTAGLKFLCHLTHLNTYWLIFV